MNQSNEHAEKIKKTIEDVIGTNTNLKRRRKTEDDLNLEKFELIIRTLEEIEIRSVLLEEDFKLGFSTYDEKFYLVIDNLLELYLGKEALSLIDFYLFGRINPDGTYNQLADIDGNLVPLNDISDLWDVVQQIKKHK